ncbi:hypothetical protein WMY93_019054 [Mugilogobius chulae]|uniref:Ig-like domain-containing protein n=1 Tax=Mugilogobius chulae TaxID=88201 RepID=A0AAW0ND77_9GOBI
MSPLCLCLLLGAIVAVNSESHSLTYIYTALSKQVNNPGIHEFTAMGLLDTKMIDYFDSERQEKVPKQDWMKERLNKDYWEKGTQSRKSKQQWFKVNLDILKNRKNQTDDDVHVLQWMHGCEAELNSEGKLDFVRGIDQYSYDGDSFLYFDDAVSVWVAAATEAEPTKRKWDEVQVLKDYTKGYLERECLDWLTKFMDYGKQQLIHAKPPDVYMFASPARHKSSVRLNCMATGFYPPDIVINLLRNGRVLKDDIISTGIRPNQDDTYQRRDSIEIVRTDQGQYSCEVLHAATNVRIEKKWDGDLPPHPDDIEEGGGVPIAAIAGAICGVLVLVGVIVAVVVVMKKKKQASPIPLNDVKVAHMEEQKNKLIPGRDSPDSGKGSNQGSSDDNSSNKSDSPTGSQDSGLNPSDEGGEQTNLMNSQAPNGPED